MDTAAFSVFELMLTVTRRSAVLVLLMTAIFAFYVAMQREGNNWGGDFSLYLMHARNISQGHSYAKTPFVYDEQALIQSPPVYPPGYPAVLAPVYKVFGLNYRALKTATVLFLILSLWPLYLLARTRIGDSAIWLVAVVALTYPFLSFKDLLAPEGPYLLFSFWSLSLAHSVYENARDRSQPMAWGAVTGLLFAAAYLTRSVGFALPAALVMFDVFRNRRITRYLVASLATFVVVCAVWSLLVDSGKGYAGQFTFGVVPVASHFVTFVKLYSTVWTNGYSPLYRYLCWAVLSALALLGFARRMRATPGLLEWYAIIYLGGISLFHESAFRYLVPVVPIYVLWIFEGLQALPALLPRNVARAVTAVAVLLMTTSALANMTTLERDPILNGVLSPEFRAVSAYIEREAGPGATVVSWNPRVFALYTGKTSLAPFGTTDWAAVSRYYKRHGVSHEVISLDETSDEPRRALIAQHPAMYRQVYANPRYVVYRLDLSQAAND